MSEREDAALDAQIHAGLVQARWYFDEHSNELDIVLAGGRGRAGVAKLMPGDYYVRVDIDTGEPLSIIIPGPRERLEDSIRAEQVLAEQAAIIRQNFGAMLTLAQAPEGYRVQGQRLAPVEASAGGPTVPTPDIALLAMLETVRVSHSPAPATTR